MKQFNCQKLFRYRFLLLIPLCAVLVIVILWLSGWFDEMIYIAEGHVGGNEESDNGHFVYNLAGEENLISVEFTELEGNASIMIYVTDSKPEDILGYKDEWMDKFALFEERKVAEPGITSFDMHQYPLNRYYLITIEGEDNSTYEYMISVSESRSRIRNMMIEIFGAEKLYGKTIQEFLFP
ncbi:MAG: hypothetical protein NC089_04065 [Bacteroides sp.]|nr:hypothetical protein [Bacteroides sp.]MCM1548570.1 hypothetical protein [Clostridium sp.]